MDIEFLPALVLIGVIVVIFALIIGAKPDDFIQKGNDRDKYYGPKRHPHDDWDYDE